MKPNVLRFMLDPPYSEYKEITQLFSQIEFQLDTDWGSKNKNILFLLYIKTVQFTLLNIATIVNRLIHVIAIIVKIVITITRLR